ncbi:MAG: hypothetical protein N4J56_006725 [Chroococcidiopsis sp. SAG 2025]|uniref:helix-turn-helix domain-containing protein n=1 Tax=Chroococcidiopsis sp. SAG 2025 TaxID=171389 RepID=UPI002937281A|nr:helix-turn-helix domain-containing protein [Chroococcidiopsis sp. SAG 2025]MDV2997020.1 hypothetical protein [Chroococcidiopsis sp. SAG 2025]
MIATDCKNDNFSDVLNQLDDFGLTPNQFRVYCHLLRSAVDGVVANESGESIAKICGLSRITAMRVLSQLSKMHLIECEVTPGKKTIYHLMPYASWRIPIPQEKKQTHTRQSKVVQFRASHTTQPNADTCKAGIQVNEIYTQQGRQDNPIGLSCLLPAVQPVNEIDVSNPETGSLEEKLILARARGWRDTGTWWNDLGIQVVTVNRFVVSVVEFMQRSLDSFDVGRQVCVEGLALCRAQIERIQLKKQQQREMALAHCPARQLENSIERFDEYNHAENEIGQRYPGCHTGASSCGT